MNRKLFVQWLNEALDGKTDRTWVWGINQRGDGSWRWEKPERHDAKLAEAGTITTWRLGPFYVSRFRKGTANECG